MLFRGGRQKKARAAGESLTDFLYAHRWALLVATAGIGIWLVGRYWQDLAALNIDSAGVLATILSIAKVVADRERKKQVKETVQGTVAVTSETLQVAMGAVDLSVQTMDRSVRAIQKDLDQKHVENQKNFRRMRKERKLAAAEHAAHVDKLNEVVETVGKMAERFDSVDARLAEGDERMNGFEDSIKTLVAKVGEMKAKR